MKKYSERIKTSEKLYSQLTSAQKKKHFSGTITAERRGKSHEAQVIQDRIEQEKAAGIRRGGK